MKPFEAALKGSREIAFAVVAMTITLAAVYAPRRLPDRPHRPAVHRVRADAGRRGARLRLRRADAVADDVVAAAQAPARATALLYRIIERGLRGDQPRLPRAAALRPDHPRRRGRGAGVVVGAVAVPAVRVAAAGTGAGRGSRHDHRHRHRARRLDHRLHRPLRAAIEAIYAQDPAGREVLHGRRLPGRRPARSRFVRLKDWERARRQASSRSCGQLAPQMFGGIPGILAFPINPPSLGQSFDRASRCSSCCRPRRPMPSCRRRSTR